MKHPGGDVAVPYLVEENSRLVLSRFDTEVLSERVRAPEPEEDESPAADVEPEDGAGE
jgi:hypothetical protein